MGVQGSIMVVVQKIEFAKLIPSSNPDCNCLAKSNNLYIWTLSDHH